MTGQYKYLDKESGFYRYIYDKVWDEERHVWKAAITVLGIILTAIGVVLSSSGKIDNAFFIASQILWLGGMVEIMILSDFNNKRIFLIEMEVMDEDKEEVRNNLLPYWERWSNENQFRKICPYTLSLLGIIIWAFCVFIVCWSFIRKSNAGIDKLAKYYDVILTTEIVAVMIVAFFSIFESLKINSILPKEKH